MKKWNILNELTSNKDTANAFENQPSRNINSTKLVEQLLSNRGITTLEEKNIFLNPPSILSLIANFPADFKTSLKKAKELILNATSTNTPIVIHGDYDCDGVCSTAILYRAIKNDLKYEHCFYFIPNRFDHGYGLSVESVNEVVEMLSRHYGDKSKNSQPPQKILFITVDSGITAVSQIDYIKSLGHDVIITDHHHKPNTLPNADCIVWCEQIVATSIAWILARVLGSKDFQAIGLAALATITDLQPVLNFNRSIVKEGLVILNNNPPLGIQKLLNVSGRRDGEVTTYDLGWVLGPRLNAMGRLEEASAALQLFLENDETKVFELAQNLNLMNTKRQDKTLEMYEFAKFSQEQENNLPKIILSAHQNYHEGIIGLVAARLVQKYYRPAIVINLGEEHGKGSVRSIPGIDIISLLRRFENLFVNLGGHPMAAGFTITKENIRTLHENLLKVLDLEFTDETLFISGIDVDLEIPLDAVNIELLEEINKLKPFGTGNPEPLFLSKKVGVANINLVGKEQQHVSLKLYSEGKTHKAIFFNGTETAGMLKTGDIIDVVYYIRENSYNGGRYVDLVIRDFRGSAL